LLRCKETKQKKEEISVSNNSRIFVNHQVATPLKIMTPTVFFQFYGPYIHKRECGFWVDIRGSFRVVSKFSYVYCRGN
jgi:hypothetical protein